MGHRTRILVLKESDFRFFCGVTEAETKGKWCEEGDKMVAALVS